MKKLLNLCSDVRIDKYRTVYSTLECRQEFINLAFKADNMIKAFCISFQKYDLLLLNKFISGILCNKELKDFVSQCDELVLSRRNSSEVNYKDVFNDVFPFDEKYFDIAEIISEQSGFCSLKYFYIVINYIDDNLPIVLKEALSEEEESFMDFLLDIGDEKMYSEKYGKVVDSLIKSICEKYERNNLNDVLNLALIQKVLKKNKYKFFKNDNLVKSACDIW